MRSVILIVIALVIITSSGLKRQRRVAYDLPDGVELLIGSYKTTFSCQGLRYGYYADVENDCKLFHICHTVELADGTVQNNHWSFVCGNQTVFNQLTLTCSNPEDAIPCENARDFYYVNDNFGIENAHFLTNEDVDKGNDYIVRAYGDRIGKK